MLFNDREIFDEYYPRLISFFRKYAFSYEDSEDLASEVLTNILTALEQHEPENLEAFIIKSASNLMKNKLRHGSAKKRQGKLVSLESSDQEPASDAFNPETYLLSQEKSEASWLCAKKLNPSQRQVFVMINFMDMDQTDVAANLKIPSGTLKSRLSFARKAVAQCLERLGLGVSV